MRKNRKAILLSLLTIAGIASCSIQKKELDDNIEEYSVIESNSDNRDFSDIELCDKTYTYEVETETSANETYQDKTASKETSDFLEVGKYAFLLEDSVLYTLYENEMYKITDIEKYQKVFVESSNGEYARVHTDNDMIGYISIKSLEYLPKDYIELDLSDQEVKVYNDDELVFRANVVTGKPSTPTDEGYTEILEKTYKRYLVGSDYKVWVEYFFSFNYSGEGYHDASWQPSFGGDAYLYRGSHGCCNMSISNIELMDRYIEVGTKNLVHK